MRIALLPLDSRPCNWQFPAMIGRIAGIEVMHPNPGDLGDLHTPADTSAMVAWLEDATGRADAMIVSADMLIYGGLVASRKPRVLPGEAEQRMAAIARIHRRRRAPVLVFGTIMRLAPTVDSETSRDAAEEVVRLVRLWHKPRRTDADRLAIQELEERLPPHVLSDYHAAREVHHLVNLALRDLGRERGIRVVFYQDDAAPEGPHLQEARALGGAVPGADEAAVMAVASARGRDAAAVRFQVEYESDEGAETISLWEDRPIREAVDLHCAALGDRVAAGDDAGRSDAILLVHTPHGFQADLASAPPEAESYRTEEFVARVARALEGDRPVGIADLRYCNGADPELIETLRRHRLLARLGAYAGWNTSGNSIGTALAHLSARAVGLGLPGRAGRLESARAHYEFLFHRLIDDYGYQSVVRPRARAAAARRGASPLDLGEQAPVIEEVVAGELSALGDELFASEFEGLPLLEDEPGGPRITGMSEFEVRLPWRRTFEVEVGFRLEV